MNEKEGNDNRKTKKLGRNTCRIVLISYTRTQLKRETESISQSARISPPFASKLKSTSRPPEYLIIGWPLQTQLKLSINFKISSIPTGWKMRAFGGSVRARKSVKMTSIRRFAWMGDRYSACVDFQSGKHALMAPTALL